MRLWPLIVWFIGDVALMRLTSRYTARIRSFQCPSFSPSSVFESDSKGKNTRHSHFPCITHSLDSYCFFDLYNIEHRLLFVSFRALVFPPPEPSFTLSLFRSYDTRTQLPPPHPPAEKTRRGKWNWRSEWSIPANILSLKVYKSPRIFIHSANVYFVHIYTSWPEYLHENGYTGGGFFKY